MAEIGTELGVSESYVSQLITHKEENGAVEGVKSLLGFAPPRIMRPGSAELIEHYRRCAERGETLTADPSDPVPMLPGEDNALKRIKEMEMNNQSEVKTNLDRAIDRILSDEGTQYIESRINELETELAKLKKLQRALLGKSGAGKTKSFKVDETLERKVVAFIRDIGPSKPGAISKHVGQAPINIGRLVAASDLLAKQGADVVLVEG